MLKCPLNIDSLNNMQTIAQNSINLTFKSLNSSFQKTLIFHIIPKITDFAPSEHIPRESLNIHPSLKLADPEFHKPAPIDMLLSAGPTLSLFCMGQINLSQNNCDLFLHKTKLGWIIGGEIGSIKTIKKSKCFLSDVQFDLQRFWQLEEGEY